MLPQDNPWVSRTRWLTQALIISGTLNIGLAATFAYFALKDSPLAINLTPAEPKDPLLTNAQLLRTYSLLPYQELLLRLESTDPIEEGLTKRDLSLACLVAFHHFNLDKALGGLTLQKRTLPFINSDQTIDVPVFPGLTDYQFQAILQYAKTEQWPLTSQGLFYELKLSRDPTLLDAFYLSPEYHAAHTLFTKTGLNLTREQTVDLLAEGEWKTLSDLSNTMDLTPDRRRLLLLDYLNHHSPLAAKLLLDNDPDFAAKRLDDGQILNLLDLYPPNSTLLQFAKDLLSSPRTDAVCRRAASLLYASAGEPLPEPYNHTTTLQRFLPTRATIQAPTPPPPKPTKKIHTVQPGDNLWKIARKYHVSVDELMRTNRMDTEKLRPGKQLEIPDKKS